jgi:hypothetical protein
MGIDEIIGTKREELLRICNARRDEYPCVRIGGARRSEA